MPFPLQQLEGKYEILEKIAEGGMGAVYKVRHRLLEEVRVIKVTRPQLENQEEIKSRFLREAKIAIRMRHVNIAQMYDFSMDEAGNSFIVMEYIDGITLQQMLKRVGPPGVGLVLEIAHQSLQALGYLHRKGIVHRDISPDNLMVGEDELGDPAVKLIDLGIAKATGGESNLTATGLFLGKIKYASPEHFKSTEGVNVDARSDLYSFGLVLYELLTGQHPISGTNWSELIAGHLFEPPRDFAITDPEGRIPAGLRKVVIHSLAKDPDERYADARTFRKAVLHLQTSLPVEPDEFARILDLRRRDHAAREAVPAGSTQGRLDEQFARESRPPPVGADATRALGGPPTATPPPTPAPAADPRTQRRVTELLAGAERLAQLEMHEEAKVQVRAALALDPDNRATTTMLERIEAEQHRAAAVAAAVASIEQLLVAERLDDAHEALAESIRRIGEAEELQALRSRLEQLEAQRRFAAVKAIVEEAEELSSAGRHDEAAGRYRQALEIDPTNTVVQRHMEASEQAVRQQYEEEQQRQAARREAIAVVNELAAAEQYEEADTRLQRAVSELGQGDDFQAAAARLHEQRTSAAARLLWEAQQLVGEKRFDHAIAMLERAHELDDVSSEVANRLAEVREAHRLHEEEQERSAVLAQAVSATESLLSEGRFDDASARLAETLAKLGQLPELVALRDEVAASQRRHTAAELVREAEEALAGGRFESALQRLEQAVELDPDSSTASDRLAAARNAWQQQQEAERRAAEIAESAATVQGLIDSGRHEDALRAVDRALGEHDEAYELTRLREQVLERLRLQSRDRLVEEAGAHLAGKRFERAIKALEQAQELDPSSTLVGARLSEALQAQQRETGISAKVDSIEACLLRDAVDEALEQLTDAVAEHGTDERLKDLRDRIVQLQNEQLASSVAAMVSEAESALGQGDADAAVSVLEQALDLSPDSTVVGHRLDEARRAQQRAAAERERAARIAEIVSAIEALLGAGELDQARSRIDAAMSELGDDDSLRSVHARAVQLEEERRTAEVDRLVQEADTQGEEGDDSAAVALLEKALDLDVGNRLIQARLADAREAQDRRAVDTAAVAARDQVTILGPLPGAGEDHTVAMARPGEPEPAEDRTRAMEVPADADLTVMDTAAALAEDRTTAIDATQLESPETPVSDATIMDRVEPQQLQPKPARRPVAEPTAPHVIEIEAPAPSPPSRVVRAEVRDAPLDRVAEPSEERRRGLPWALIGVAAAAIVVVAIVVMIVGGRGGTYTPREGTLIINALPWAEVESLVDEAGSPVAVPEASYTPLSLTLAPGRYRVSMRHPGSTDPILVEAEVVAGQPTSAPVAKFTTLDADTVLERYGL